VTFQWGRLFFDTLFWGRWQFCLDVYSDLCTSIIPFSWVGDTFSVRCLEPGEAWRAWCCNLRSPVILDLILGAGIPRTLMEPRLSGGGDEAAHSTSCWTPLVTLPAYGGPQVTFPPHSALQMEALMGCCLFSLPFHLWFLIDDCRHWPRAVTDICRRPFHILPLHWYFSSLRYRRYIHCSRRYSTGHIDSLPLLLLYLCYLDCSSHWWFILLTDSLTEFIDYIDIDYLGGSTWSVLLLMIITKWHSHDSRWHSWWPIFSATLFWPVIACRGKISLRCHDGVDGTEVTFCLFGGGKIVDHSQSYIRLIRYSTDGSHSRWPTIPLLVFDGRRDVTGCQSCPHRLSLSHDTFPYLIYIDHSIVSDWL